MQVASLQCDRQGCNNIGLCEDGSNSIVYGWLNVEVRVVGPGRSLQKDYCSIACAKKGLEAQIEESLQP